MSPAFLVLAALALGAGAQAVPKASPGAAAPARTPTRLNRVMANLPLTFEANRGQTSAQAQFLARSAGSVVFLTSQGAVVKTTRQAVSMNFAGATLGRQGEGAEPTTTAITYLTGDRSSWRRSVPGFARVRYRSLYPGVDLAYYGNRGDLEYDLQLAPLANPNRIQLQFAGAEPAVTARGALRLGNDLTLRAPQAYQTVNGRRRAVAVRYVRNAEDRYGFVLGNYDPTLSLTIDPVLSFSSLLGGTNFNQANAVAVDSTGDGYVAGFTLSADFPTVGPIQAALSPGTSGPDFDAFISEVKSDGTALIYSTYLGGNGDDEATGIAVDSTGAAYVTGFTSSTNFPVTTGVVQATLGGGYDAFVSKLSPGGTALVYSTYLGGSQDDKAAAIAVDAAGNAYIAGSTSSSNFPVSTTAPQVTYGGHQNAFVAALNPAGTALLYSTYLGGTATASRGAVDRATGIAVDQTGNAYVSGATSSPDFPVTPGVLQTALAGGFDGFVAKVDRSGTTFDYATYLGGSRTDEANAIAVDAAGDAYVAGDTASINIFPISSSAFQQNFAGGASDAFVAELNKGGSALVYGTYLGGAATDVATGIVVDGQNNAYVTGYTSSLITAPAFPTTSNATQASPAGVQDAFLSKVNAVGQNVLFSTFFGGTATTSGEGIGIDANGDVYIVGVTQSPDFPVTTGVFQTAANSLNDAFVAKFVAAPQGVFTPGTVGFPAQAVSTASAAESATFTNGGEKALVISGIAVTGPYAETDNCNANSSTLQPGQTCTLNIVFTPTATGAQNGTLVISDNAPGGSQTLQLTGSGGDFTLTATPTTLDITAGAEATYSLNITPATGYTQVVQLTCTGTGTNGALPANSTCVASPTSETMNGSTTSIATFTVTTTVRPTLVPPLPSLPRDPWLWVAMLLLGAFALVLIALWRRRAVPWTTAKGLRWIAGAVLLAWAAAAVACGGTTTNQGTPAGNYFLNLVGTVGSTSHSVQVQLTVN